ncbi:MAG: hypothetical protein COA83_02890 [Methylophaga sp.]|nr:MAG: hypothetical protein COA83_02890 [Methylophaga sp.]
MIALLFIGVFVIYLIISIKVIGIGRTQAQRRGYKRWHGGLLAALIMYNLVFWDLIPVYAVHAYQCKNNAGFTVYKTLEQWKQENPGVADTLIPIKNSPSTKTDKTTRYQLNQRFAWDTTYTKIWNVVRKTDERIIDTETGEVLAQYIDFSASVGRLYNANKVSDYKFWFEARSCERSYGTIVYREDKNAYEWIGKGSPPTGYQFNKLKSHFKYSIKEYK